MNFFLKIISYLVPITLKTYRSSISGELLIVAENGKKVLNTRQVNYSFNSLHRIFKAAFKKTGLPLSNDSKVLMLGLGAGSIAHIIRNEYQSKASITAIEIDPVVIEIAKTEFGIEQLQPIYIVQGDAIEYVLNLTSNFDIICVDLFVQDRVPQKFLHAEFIDQLITSLNPGGKIYFNFMDCSAELTGLFNQRVEALNTSKHSFSSIVQLNLEENNRVLVVTK
jgi:spermidine synthase